MIRCKYCKNQIFTQDNLYQSHLKTVHLGNGKTSKKTASKKILTVDNNNDNIKLTTISTEIHVKT